MVKKKGKKGKSSAADEGGEGQSTAEQYVPLDVPDEVDEFVTLDMRLLNWSYLNFRLKTKTTTRLFSIKVGRSTVQDR
ncbi:hypothetical protein AaE_011271 [Aphanomyces astaci]|uniref:Uncharacterized protein n=1 Tax=Aphanomyces astaci TaxID=112090 RepID=A0A6A4ZR79_APHAT|nr:hypothetical protein AaE_011271 [Aphanomyces astaci]